MFCYSCLLLRYAVLLASFGAAGAWAADWEQCYETAGNLHRVSPDLLRAVAQVESGGRPLAVNDKQPSGTAAIGLMQIDESNIGGLRKFGVTREMLWKPCVSIHVGAWLLSDLFQRLGEGWEAVGAYNSACIVLKGAACRKSRDTYIYKVQRAMARLEARRPSQNQLERPLMAVVNPTGLMALEFDGELKQHALDTDSSYLPN